MTTDFRELSARVAARIDAIDIPRWQNRARVVAFALVGATLALALFGRIAADVGPFETTVSARPSFGGETVAKLAPLGEIHLDTHSWPLTLEVRVDQLGYEEAQRIAENPERIEELGDDLADEVGSAFVGLALRCLMLAVIGGGLGALVARSNWRTALAGTATGATVVVLTIAGTVATFNVNAVSEPRYSGLLTMTPRAVGDVESIIDRYGEYRSQLAELVNNVVTLYVAAEGLPTVDLGDDTIRVLHVSDLHLSLHAYDVMDRLVDQFDIDVIADTGDTTDWGTSMEDNFVNEIGSFDVPYVWVRGNHDSRGTQRAIAALPNTVVLDGEAAEVAGLRFWGIGDPRYTPDKDQPNSPADQRDRTEAFAPVAAESLRSNRPPDVDVALVHDPRVAAELGGEVPLILAGHTHKVEERRLGDDGDTVLLVEGSTGGAGLRGLQGEEPASMTATVLYFDPETAEVVAYDRITVEGLGGGATIQRSILLDDDGDEQDEEDDDGDEQDDDEQDDEDGEGED